MKSENLNLASIGKLTFEEPDLIKFRCIDLAYQALRSGGSYLPVLNIANELSKRGVDITYVKPDLSGMIKIDDVKKNIKSNTKLIGH